MSISREFAKTDTAKAIGLAMANGDAWFRCQDFAWALRYAPDTSVPAINGLIECHAAQCRDDYQRSAVRAWQIRALAERGVTSQAKRVTEEALRVAMAAIPMSSRSEALYLLFSAAFPLGAVAIAPLAAALLECQEPRSHWRVIRNMVHVLAMLRRTFPAEFERLQARISDDKLHHRIEREAGLASCEPRPFFW